MSRQLKFYDPIALTMVRIHTGHYSNCPKPEYLEKFDTVYTRLGLVTVSQINWQTNHGKTIWTVFETVINGNIYRAEINEAPISNRSLKWLSSHFINQIHKNLTPCAPSTTSPSSQC